MRSAMIRRNIRVVLVMMQQHLRKSILEMKNFQNFKVPMNSVVAERDDASPEVIAAPHNGFVENIKVKHIPTANPIVVPNLYIYNFMHPLLLEKL